MGSNGAGKWADSRRAVVSTDGARRRREKKTFCVVLLARYTRLRRAQNASMLIPNRTSRKFNWIFIKSFKMIAGRGRGRKFSVSFPRLGVPPGIMIAIRVSVSAPEKCRLLQRERAWFESDCYPHTSSCRGARNMRNLICIVEQEGTDWAGEEKIEIYVYVKLLCHCRDLIFRRNELKRRRCCSFSSDQSAVGSGWGDFNVSMRGWMTG